MTASKRFPVPSVERPQRRSGSIALVLLGAAAVGVGGGWAIDRFSQPACDPKLDPNCPPRSSGWFRSGSGGSYRGHDYSTRSRDTPPVASAPSARRSETTRRGGFGSVGRLFSAGS